MIWKKKALYGLLIYAGFVISLILVGVVASPKASDTTDRIDIGGGFTQLPDVDRPNKSGSGTPVPLTSPTLGKKDASITIVEFGDFECSFTKASFPVIRRIVNEYPDDVRLVYRHFPLQSIHPLAKELAHASMCAHDQGLFWAFHDQLFQYQGSITEENLEDHAGAVGLNMERFRQCQSSNQWEGAIEQDLADAVAYGSRGTPSWLVNGQFIQGHLTFETWKQIIESLL